MSFDSAQPVQPPETKHKNLPFLLLLIVLLIVGGVIVAMYSGLFTKENSPIVTDPEESGLSLSEQRLLESQRDTSVHVPSPESQIRLDASRAADAQGELSNSYTPPAESEARLQESRAQDPAPPSAR